MESKDIIVISQRAKSETENFINRHLDDHAKGWPKVSLCGSDNTRYKQQQKSKKLQMVF